jgi:hypothetical protein
VAVPTTAVLTFFQNLASQPTGAPGGVDSGITARFPNALTPPNQFADKLSDEGNARCALGTGGGFMV